MYKKDSCTSICVAASFDRKIRNNPNIYKYIHKIFQKSKHKITINLNVHHNVKLWCIDPLKNVN